MNRFRLSTLLRHFILHPSPFILVLFLLHPSSYIRSQDTIKANPNAVQLKLFWKLEGVNPNDVIGGGIGGIGDIDGDGRSEFLLMTGRPWQWSLYHGDAVKPWIDTTWKFDSGSGTPTYPVVGDFYGKGQKAIGLGRFKFEGPTSRSHYWLHFFRVGNGRIADTASVVWDSYQKDGTAVDVSDIKAVDLDGDGADELIVFSLHEFRNNVRDDHAEIWIYKGGENFRLDTPTVILRDPDINENPNYYRGAVADIDGDSHLDFLTLTSYFSRGVRLHIYFGQSGLPLSGMPVDRNIPFPDSRFIVEDYDGDGVAEVVTTGLYIFRSSVGKSARTRAYDSADADIWLRTASGFYENLGYLNNKKYPMFDTYGAGPKIYGFSGGANGPNRTYDCYYSALTDFVDNIFVNVRPTADIDGDGWDDLIVSNGRYYSGWNYGMAIILKGGPYIPNDDPTVEVRSITSEGKQDAIRMWPNPVSKELNIAWRGDLKRMPERFVVYNALGQYVTGGSVPDGSGSAVWECSGVPSGVYRVLIYDGNSVLLAQKQIIKQ